MKALVYLLQVSACSGIFYLLYYVVLSRLTFFTLNRFYLLAGLVLSFLIPLITIPQQVQPERVVVMRQAVYNEQWFITPPMAVQQPIAPVEHSVNWLQMLNWMYVAAVVVLIIHLTLTLMAFRRKTKGQKLAQVGQVRIVRSGKSTGNSSFLNYIFLNDEQLSAEEIQQIIAHELLHVKLYHSVDRITAKIAQIILWFNPFIYLYGRAIETNHEFEVDRELAREGDRELYANLLVHLSVAGNGTLYHHFSRIPLKKRITMLFHKPSANMKKVMYLLMVPVVLMSCLAFARMKNSKENKNALKHSESSAPFFLRVHLNNNKHDLDSVRIENKTGSRASAIVAHNAKVGIFLDHDLYSLEAFEKLSPQIREAAAASPTVGVCERRHYKSLERMGYKADKSAYDVVFEVDYKHTFLQDVGKEYRKDKPFNGGMSRDEYVKDSIACVAVVGKQLEFKITDLVKGQYGKGLKVAYQGRQYMIPAASKYGAQSKLYDQLKAGDLVEINVRQTVIYGKSMGVAIIPRMIIKNGQVIYQDGSVKAAKAMAGNKVDLDKVFAEYKKTQTYRDRVALYNRLKGQTMQVVVNKSLDKPVPSISFDYQGNKFALVFASNARLKLQEKLQAGDKITVQLNSMGLSWPDKNGKMIDSIMIGDARVSKNNKVIYYLDMKYAMKAFDKKSSDPKASLQGIPVTNVYSFAANKGNQVQSDNWLSQRTPVSGQYHFSANKSDYLTGDSSMQAKQTQITVPASAGGNTQEGTKGNTSDSIRQKLKKEVRKEMNRQQREHNEFLNTPEGREKDAMLKAVQGKQVRVTVSRMIPFQPSATANTLVGAQGSIFVKYNGYEYKIPTVYGEEKALNTLLKTGDQIDIKVFAGGYQNDKTSPVSIEPMYVLKDGKKIYEIAGANGIPKYPFLYEANGVRFADGQVTDIEKNTNGSWKSATLEVINGYKFKLTFKPGSPNMASIQWGDHVRLRFVHEQKAGGKSYNVKDWVSITTDIHNYGIRNPELFNRFYESVPSPVTKVNDTAKVVRSPGKQITALVKNEVDDYVRKTYALNQRNMVDEVMHPMGMKN